MVRRKGRFKKGSLAAKRFMAKIRRKAHKKRKSSRSHKKRRGHPFRKFRSAYRRFKRHLRNTSSKRRHFRSRLHSRVSTSSAFDFGDLAIGGIVTGLGAGLLFGHAQAQNPNPPPPPVPPPPNPNPPPPNDSVYLNVYVQSISQDGLTYTYNGVATSSQGNITKVHWQAVEAPQFSFDVYPPNLFPQTTTFASGGNKTYYITAFDNLGQNSSIIVAVNVVPSGNVTGGGQKAPNPPPPLPPPITNPPPNSPPPLQIPTGAYYYTKAILLNLPAPPDPDRSKYVDPNGYGSEGFPWLGSNGFQGAGYYAFPAFAFEVNQWFGNPTPLFWVGDSGSFNSLNMALHTSNPLPAGVIS